MMFSNQGGGMEIQFSIPCGSQEPNYGYQFLSNKQDFSLLGSPVGENCQWGQTLMGSAIW